MHRITKSLFKKILSSKCVIGGSGLNFFTSNFRYQWSLDKVTLTDGYGKTMSFCQVHPLPSGIPIKFKFKAEDCVSKSALSSHEYAFSTANKMVCCWEICGIYLGRV